MVVCCTVVLTLVETPISCRKTLMTSRNGRGTGSWNFPQKCQTMHITNKRKPITVPYTKHGHVLEQVDTAKYLGANIHKSLNQNHHISTVTKKANNTSSFLQHNISQCPKKTKELCYITLDGICHCHLGSVHRSKCTEIGNGAA